MLRKKISARLLRHLLLVAFLCLPSIGIAKKNVQSEIDAFVQKMVVKHKVDKQRLTKMFQSFKFQPRVIELITRPAESLTWAKYQPIFLTEKRAKQGVEFWKKHEQTLAKAEQKFGVDAQIIVAVIGVETFYGGLTGSHRIIDALGTLAFGYPRRAKFFSRELESFILLAYKEKIDPLSIKGSYAGAMGIPQFMPSSYQAWAIDFDGDGKKDLWKNPADAIGSVANYLKKHGWKRGAAITYPVTVSGKFKKALSKSIKLKYTLKQLAAYGVAIPAQLKPSQKGLLVDLTLKNGKEYWLGLHNFYVITRYNHSTLYGMAVYQLSQDIVARKQG